MRKVFILTMALVASVLGAAPASAEPEPDNWIWQATGPVTTPTITGAIASNNDYDWYMIYAASQSQLAITLQTSTCGSDHSLALYDSTGDQITYRYGSQTKPSTINNTTGIGTTRYFLRMRGSCIGSYRVDVSPAAALLGGSPMPNNTVKTGEPNENADQAQGPLSADVVYVGAGETSNDEDWFYFYANAAFNVTATSGDTLRRVDCALRPGTGSDHLPVLRGEHLRHHRAHADLLAAPLPAGSAVTVSAVPTASPSRQPLPSRPDPPLRRRHPDR